MEGSVSVPTVHSAVVEKAWDSGRGGPREEAAHLPLPVMIPPEVLGLFESVLM